jgi:hypothetical protein
MWTMLIGTVLLAALALVWLNAGRRITLFVDRWFTLSVASLPVSPVEYDGGGLRIAGLPMTFGGIDNLRWPLKVHTADRGHLAIAIDSRSFALAPREPADEVAFTARRSVLSWPVPPFQISILGTRSPRWKRYVYYRLTWRKPSGARLAMFWRYEQQYYSDTGWGEPLMMWNSQTGLLRVEITAETIQHESVVTQYLTHVKGWELSQYRIESRGLTSDGLYERIAVIHRDDERAPSPGAGKSIELLLDRSSHQVVKELGGQ